MLGRKIVPPPLFSTLSLSLSFHGPPPRGHPAFQVEWGRGVRAREWFFLVPVGIPRDLNVLTSHSSGAGSSAFREILATEGTVPFLFSPA